MTKRPPTLSTLGVISNFIRECRERYLIITPNSMTITLGPAEFDNLMSQVEEQNGSILIIKGGCYREFVWGGVTFRKGK